MLEEGVVGVHSPAVAPGQDLLARVPTDWFIWVNSRVKGNIPTAIRFALLPELIRAVAEHNTLVIAD